MTQGYNKNNDFFANYYNTYCTNNYTLNDSNLPHQIAASTNKKAFEV